MKFPGLNARRSKSLMLVLAQLVLVAYIFQVGAFDHWNVDPAHDVKGVEQSAMHIAHCHGSVADCAETGGASSTILPEDSLPRLPMEHLTLSAETSLGVASPDEALIPPPAEPPRAA